MADDFIKALQAEGLQVTSAEQGAMSMGYLDTGNYALNWAISNKFYGGWPLGAVVELFGDPSTGKSFLVARAIASALSGGGVALLDDTEGAFNSVWAASKLGVDTSHLAYLQSESVEDHYKAVDAFATTCAKVDDLQPSVLALDSLALLSTKHEQEVKLEKPSMTRAKNIRTMLRLLAGHLHKVPAVYILANHTIDNIGGYGPQKTTPGGSGPKFQSSVRIGLMSPQKVKVGTDIVGVKIRARVEKNRLAVPWRECDMIIPFFESINPVSGLIPLLLDRKVLEVPGRSLNLKLRGEDTGIKAYKSDENRLRQEQSGKQLLHQFPELLRELDAESDNDMPNLGEAEVEE